MAEQLTVYQPGDRFATMGRDGEARIWTVTEHGVTVLAAGRNTEMTEALEPEVLEPGMILTSDGWRHPPADWKPL